MYEIDDKDEVVKLEGVPQSSIGAPIPLVLADEHRIVLAYYLEDQQSGSDGTSIRVIDAISSTEPIAIVRFDSPRAHMFGPPNDEAFSGHPLASRGLRPYSAFEIKNSSWIRRLERMNSVHQFHRPESFWSLRHLIFAFHDSTFECACRAFSVTTTHGSIQSVIPEMTRLLYE